MSSDAMPLRDRRILVVEDDFLVAADLVHILQDLGATVVGPADSVTAALGLIEDAEPLHAAVLDVNLGDEKAYPIADTLRASGVPLVFTTGYDAWIIPDHYSDVPHCQKPIDMDVLERLLVVASRPESSSC